MHTVTAVPITPAAFAPFGDVIAPGSAPAALVNAARFDRFDGLARVDCGADINVGIMRCANATALPCTIDLMECHPQGSQAFLPLDPLAFVIALAPPAAVPVVADVRAFVVPPYTGINMHAGVWHVPLLGSVVGQCFAVIDRAHPDNCDEVPLPEPFILEATL
ncbi:MAG: ureidoglycolate lyase [Pseudomonadota bacterium]